MDLSYIVPCQHHNDSMIFIPISLGNSLAPGWCQTIIQINTEISLFGLQIINSNEISIDL